MRFASGLILAAAAAGVLPLHAQREKLSWDDREYVEKTWPEAVKTSTGLRYVILRQGTGSETPKPGDVVLVIYTGRLLSGKVFGQELNKEEPFRIRLGRGSLIPAWEETLQRMKRGEKRLIIVPPELGYGTRGDPERGVPRSAALVFEIEIVDFRSD